MPTKMATYCCEKAVLVTVYVEKPRRRILHHHLHHTIRKEVIQQERGVTGEGCNRRAELLHYCQRLRLSAPQLPPPASTSSQSKPDSSTHQQPSNKNATVQRTTKHSRTPAWLRKWIILIPSFLRSLTSPSSQVNQEEKETQ
ncbi:hypothetical protein SLE2022_090440 [Rubroshorea leprosula]